MWRRFLLSEESAMNDAVMGKVILFYIVLS